MKKIISTLFKISVSAILLIYLFRKIDIKDVLQNMQGMYIPYILIGMVLYILGQVVCAYRWKLLSEILDFQYRLKEFVILYFAGLFFSLFLPTAVGGDVGKCYFLARRDGKILPAIVSVLADRGTGLVVIVLLSGISLYLYGWTHIPQQITLGILIANILLIIALIAPFFIGKYLSLLGRPAALSLTFWKNPSSLVKAIAISFVFHMMIIMIHILIGLSLNLNIPWRYYFFLIPLVVTISMLPISLAGLGIREGAYVYFLSLIGIPQTEAMTFAFGWLFIVMVSSLLGGLSLFSSTVKRKGLAGLTVRQDT